MKVYTETYYLCYMHMFLILLGYYY